MNVSKLAITALATNMVSAKLGYGDCPEVEVMRDIDVDRFQGRWYQYARSANAIWNSYYECTTAQFEKDQNGDLRYNFRGNFAYPFSWYGDCSGNLVRIGETDGATGTLIVDRSPNKDRDYYIVGTDYDNWYVKYRCKETAWGYAHWIDWAIMSRSPDLSRSDRDAA